MNIKSKGRGLRRRCKEEDCEGFPRQAFRLGLILVVCLWAITGFAADKLPPPPTRYFNDFADLVSKQTAETLNSQLEQFERDSSSQLLVVIYRKLDTDLALEDFTQRTAESWRVGQKKRDNGAVLFVFTQDRKMRIEVGYGLEGAIPDITAKQIIENELKPAFQAGNYEAGMTAGVAALIKAARGEYTGTGRTNAEGGDTGEIGFGGLLCPLIGLLFVFFFVRNLFRKGRGTMYGPRGRRRAGGSPVIFWGGGGGGWSGGGGGWSGGDSGGGFSGGGGGFGGGGASGEW